MDLTKTTTRKPERPDTAAIAVIDAEGLATGHASFRDTPHDWNSFSASFLTGRGLSLIAETERAVAAWAGISLTSPCPVYHGVGEVSIYVSATRQGSGLGRRLLGDLVLASESAGRWLPRYFRKTKPALHCMLLWDSSPLAPEGIWAG
ncbi:GNAT family N-acetyltransferase [Labrenzia sp. CE80]|uniref:GNAT family N-acetyltransferase n=1 Tax=Labrenzia sp. CE80 TaxID=1788986 RepID=UPI00129AA3E5|nr:GNAT family N-acetyltransferase [Labrenzia sp. CE80]